MSDYCILYANLGPETIAKRLHDAERRYEILQTMWKARLAQCNAALQEPVPHLELAIEALIARLHAAEARIAELTAELAAVEPAKAVVELLLVQDDRSSERIQELENVLRSSNIPILCQCSECRDICAEFGGK